MDKWNDRLDKIIPMLFGMVLGASLGLVVDSYFDTQKKYKMNLKCIQGELYEEIRPNMYAKSHLECFEQKTLVP